MSLIHAIAGRTPPGVIRFARRSDIALGALRDTIIPAGVRRRHNRWTDPPAMTVAYQRPYPLSDTVRLARGAIEARAAGPAVGGGRARYLETVAGIVGFFRDHQRVDGRIIDPYERREIQYSTPCYAWAAATLVVSGRSPDLAESAMGALDAALTQLADAAPADRHGDFFLFFSMLAYQQLHGRASPQRRQRWQRQIGSVNPSVAYSDVVSLRKWHVLNWNAAALAGELMRHHAGRGGPAFIRRYLPEQLAYFTDQGLYRDPHVPMAYDHWVRFFLATAAHGYRGPGAAELAILLERGALTSLLIQSPAGELPAGGRSAQHQWNEAMQCATFEQAAARHHAAGDPTLAGAFKRAAALAHESVRRWQRPSGDLQIVKNHVDPSLRHGYEVYSYHSQYNLIAAAMLATAWWFADETIAPGAAPCEAGGFVVHLPEFHKVIANAGGLYIEIDLAADPYYDSTGLIRVHKTGVDPRGGTSGTPIHEEPLAIGVAWREGDRWQSLAGICEGKSAPATVVTHECRPNRVRFTVTYRPAGGRVTTMREAYELTPGQLSVTVEVDGEVDALRVRFPVLVWDGREHGTISLDGAKAGASIGSASISFRVLEPEGVRLERYPLQVRGRNGMFDVVEGACAGRTVRYTLTPTSDEATKAGEALKAVQQPALTTANSR